MNMKSLAALGAAAAALAALAVLLRPDTPAARVSTIAAQAESREYLGKVNADTLRSVVVEREGQEPVVLRKQEGLWKVETPKGLRRVDRERARSIENNQEGNPEFTGPVPATAVAESEASWARLGLDAATAVKATFRGDGDAVLETLFIGKAGTQPRGTTFVRPPEGTRSYQAPLALENNFSARTAAEWRERKVMPDAAWDTIERVEVRGDGAAGGGFVLEYLGGGDNEYEGRWRATAGDKSEEARKGSGDQIARAIPLLMADEFLDEPAGDEFFTTTTIELTVKVRDIEEPMTLTIGQPVPERQNQHFARASTVEDPFIIGNFFALRASPDSLFAPPPTPAPTPTPEPTPEAGDSGGGAEAAPVGEEGAPPE
ncbi:MAG: DUF4340 domain-containing protein [Candidatus Sumerlaeia bacterium]|nr:DUF4340 domain-containing protein [Candidatus Sumerlaeia bacterium]